MNAKRGHETRAPGSRYIAGWIAGISALLFVFCCPPISAIAQDGEACLAILKQDKGVIAQISQARKRWADVTDDDCAELKELREQYRLTALRLTYVDQIDNICRGFTVTGRTSATELNSRLTLLKKDIDNNDCPSTGPAPTPKRDRTDLNSPEIARCMAAGEACQSSANQFYNSCNSGCGNNGNCLNACVNQHGERLVACTTQRSLCIKDPVANDGRIECFGDDPAKCRGRR